MLDAAHADGAVHGALHPSKVIVHDNETTIVVGTTAVLPYAAPELGEGGKPTPASDQYSLAAIVYEWLFGRPIDHPADRPVEVRSMPGVERAALSKAFTRALAPNPRDRFASCTAFCDAVANAVIPELPLLALEAEDEQVEDEHDEDDDAPVAPISAFTHEDMLDPVLAPNVDDLKIVAEETNLTAAQPDFDAIDQAVAPIVERDTSFDSGREPAFPVQDRPVASWNPAPTIAPSSASLRFGGLALILATIVGAIFGFAAGYMARPRALQSAPQEITVAKEPTTPIGGTGASGAAVTATPAPAPQALQTPKAPQAPKVVQAPQAPKAVGRLLVRSTPGGATVTVDGVAKGVTPLALRDLATGTLSISVGRRGYISESQKVTITNSRPARTLDVRLAPEAAAAPRPAASSATAKPGATTGGLTVDSRPVGAAVTINGKPSGNTPLAINDLAPGEYRILMAMPGYRNFATTVRVVAGERARAAASLTALEQQ